MNTLQKQWLEAVRTYQHVFVLLFVGERRGEAWVPGVRKGRSGGWNPTCLDV